MLRILSTITLLLAMLSVHGQDAKEYYEKGIEMARQGKPEEAIPFFDKSIALKEDEYVAWYNRGVAKVMAHRYEDALPDFDRTIILSPTYKKAFLNRGTAKKHLTDYEGAMADYDYVLRLDSSSGEAYYYRGLLRNLLGQRIPACLDFEKALRLGYKDAKPEMDGCIRRPIADDTSIHAILRLTMTADRDGYGFSPDDPVKVGKGPEGGPNNALSYLDLLRDARGHPLKYEHIGTCCPYRSDHAFFGHEALLDKYQITYAAADGSDRQAFFYITFFDYAMPLIPKGLKTVAPR